MRVSIKTKQVAGVTSIVGLAVIVLSGFYLSSLVRISLDESRARGELLASAIYQRAREVVVGGSEPEAALRADGGLRSILESSAYSRNVIYAAIADVGGVAIVHSNAASAGQVLPPYGDLGELLDRGPLAQIRAIYAQGGGILEFRKPLLLGDTEFGSIRIGVSTLLMRRDFDQSLEPALLTALAALVGSSLVAMLLAQLLLRPIHVIRSGLTRLGQGEFGVMLDLPQQDEFGELGAFFNTVSTQLATDRRPAANAENVEHIEHGAQRRLPSVADRLEDAVAVSRKLTALSRLSAGVAHEVKNPLNATVIHLELLRQELGPNVSAGALEHLETIAAQMRRLDEVVQGFLKFIRPEELKLQAVSLASLIDDIMPVVAAEAQKTGVEVRVEIPNHLPDICADPGMLEQALLNLALNACQAMPDGGRLRLAGAALPGNRVEVVFEDTGTGIPPEHLDKIFNLYFTTKPGGTGIGLAMVYRIVQLHDGEVEVQSAPGRGTTFRILLPQA